MRSRASLVIFSTYPSERIRYLPKTVAKGAPFSGPPTKPRLCEGSIPSPESRNASAAYPRTHSSPLSFGEQGAVPSSYRPMCGSLHQRFPALKARSQGRSPRRRHSEPSLDGGNAPLLDKVNRPESPLFFENIVKDIILRNKLLGQL